MERRASSPVGVTLSPTKKTAAKQFAETLGIALLYRSDAERGAGICDNEELCVHDLFGRQRQL
jgi:hypothetical protein